MENIKIKDLIIKGESAIFGVELIGIKAIGNYSKFVDINYAELQDFYNPKTKKLTSGKDYYLNLLNNGKCVQHNSYLLFAPNKNYEHKYLEYVKSYLEEESKEGLIKELKDVASYSMVKSFIKMVKEGSLSKDVGVLAIKKYFKNEKAINQYI